MIVRSASRTLAAPRRPRDRRRRLRHELLETRRVLATFTVGLTDDVLTGNCVPDSEGGGGCSLRDAVQAANSLPGLDTIRLSPGTYSLTLAGANEDNAATGDLDILDSVIIEGTGNGATIDGQNLDRIFDIAAEALDGGEVQVELSLLTLQNGAVSNGDGGAIRNHGDLTILSSQLSQNSAGNVNSLRSGGAIANFDGSILLENVIVTDNQSTLYGGGVYGEDGSISISGGTYSQNSTQFDGGGIHVREEQSVPHLSLSDGVVVANNSGSDAGGGIYVLGGRFESSGTQFLNNSIGEEGGGLLIEGGSTFAIFGGTFRQNEALDSGGGVAIANSSGFIDGTTFEFNTVLSAANFESFEDGGGGIAIVGTTLEPYVLLDSILVSGNSAPGGGGIGIGTARVTIVDSTIESNSATLPSSGGGGVGIVGGNLIIERSSIFDNTAAGSAGGVGQIVDPGQGLGDDGSIEIIKSTIFGNRAEDGGGGGIGVLGNNGARPDLVIKSSTINDNVADSGGGGIAVQGADMDLVNVTVTNNTAFSGGGISYFATDNANARIAYSTIASNSATTDSSIANLEAAGDVVVTGTIVADPLGPGSQANCGFQGNVVSLGHNLDSDGSCGFNTATDLNQADPLLQPLAGNGGPVPTRALGQGSPARDAGSPTIGPNQNDAPPTDARGGIRPAEGDGAPPARTDIGAFEANASIPTVDIGVVGPDTLGPLGFPDTATFQFRVENFGSTDATGIFFELDATRIQPSGGFLSFESVTSSQGTVEFEPSGIAVDLGGIPAGGSATIDVNVSTAMEGIDTLTALVMSAENDDNPDNDRLLRTVAIQADTQLTAVPDSATADANGFASIDVLSNDIDSTGGALQVISASQPAGGTATIVNSETIEYQAFAGFAGPDQFTYTIENIDGDTATGTVTVTVPSSLVPPIAVDDPLSAIVEGGESLIIGESTLLANDSPGSINRLVQPLSILSTDATSTAGGTIEPLGDGAFEYIAPQGFSGTDSFTYTIGNASIGFRSATVFINVSGSVESLIQGTVFCDSNGNGTFDPGEGVANSLVFVDRNDNAEFDDGELSTLTDDDGNYSLSAVAVGTAVVVADVPDGCVPAATDVEFSRTQVAVGKLARDVTSIDWNQDGISDAIVVNELSNDANLLLSNSSSGPFAQLETRSVGSRPLAVDAFTDANGPLFAVASVGTGPGSGALTVHRPGGVESIAIGDGPIDIAIADFNDDGIADFAIPSFRDAALNILLGGETAPQVIGSVRNARAVAAGDLDADGDIDLALVGSGYENDLDGEVAVLLNQGDGRFVQQATSAAPRGAVSVAIADLDNDGRAEVVTAGARGTIQIFAFDPTQASKLMPTTVFTVTPGVSSISTGDINADGLVDVVTTSLDEATIDLLVGDGSGGLEVAQTVTGVPSPIASTIDDFSGGTQPLPGVLVANFYGPGDPFGLPSTLTILTLDVAAREVIVEAAAVTRVDFVFEKLDVVQDLPIPDGEADEANLDVNRDTLVTPLDALNVINALNGRLRLGAGEELRSAVEAESDLYDVNRDNAVTPLDALLIINHLNSHGMPMEAESYSSNWREDEELRKRRRAVDIVLESFAEGENSPI